MKFGALFIAAAIGAATMSPASAQDTQPFAFQVKGDRFTLAIPDGYCRPSGEELAISRRFASADSANLTPVDIQSCGTYGEDYVLIKTPRLMGPLAVEKPAFLAMVGQQLQSEAGQQDIAKGMQQGRRDVDTEFGGDISVGAGKVVYAGSDDQCVYMSGTINVEAEGKSAPINVASCLTLVGNRHYAVHAYDFAAGSAPMDSLKARARDVATRTSPR